MMGHMTSGSRSIAASVDELVAAAERREAFDPPQKRSTARFERLWIDGEPHVLKYLHPDNDFMMRALGDDGSRALRAFAAGLFDAAADVIDHAVVGAAGGVGRDGSGCAFLMRDVSDELVAPGDDAFPDEQHRSFVENLARMCVRTWGWHDELGLAPYEARWSFTGIPFLAREQEQGDPERVGRDRGPGVGAVRLPRAEGCRRRGGLASPRSAAAGIRVCEGRRPASCTATGRRRISVRRPTDEPS